MKKIEVKLRQNDVEKGFVGWFVNKNIVLKKSFLLEYKS